MFVPRTKADWLLLEMMVEASERRMLQLREDVARMVEWREWFGFRPGWPARRAARVQALLSALKGPDAPSGPA